MLGRCSSGSSASSERRPNRSRSERLTAPGSAVAAGPESDHCRGDVLLEESIEELALRDVDCGLDLVALTPAGDPGRHAVGDHLGAHPDMDEGVVLLGDMHGDLEDEPGVLHDPPGPFPASFASRVMGETDRLVDDHTLTAAGGAAEQASNTLVEVARDPVDE
jgi:hypothetical protein